MLSSIFLFNFEFLTLLKPGKDLKQVVELEDSLRFPATQKLPASF
jgi:hypothetical protein